jgi:putative redox protein
MDAKATLKERMTFIASSDSGFEVRLDAEKSVGGDESGFEPLELLAMGLAGCTAMDVLSILRKKKQDITAFEVKVHAERAGEHPKVFTRGVIDYVISGHGIDESALLRAIELSATKYCPAQGMLSKVVPLELQYHILEAEGTTDRLVKEGVHKIAA